MAAMPVSLLAVRPMGLFILWAELQEIAAQKLPAYVFRLMGKICILIYKIGAKLLLLQVTGIKSENIEMNLIHI
jgi:hypothetical protein